MSYFDTTVLHERRSKLEIRNLLSHPNWHSILQTLFHPCLVLITKNQKSTLLIVAKAQRYRISLLFTMSHHHPHPHPHPQSLKPFDPFLNKVTGKVNFWFLILFQQRPAVWNYSLTSSYTNLNRQFIGIFKTSKIWSVVRFLKSEFWKFLALISQS